MIVDTSALVAIAFAEPDWPAYERVIASSEAPKLSASNYVEAATVIDRARHGRFSRDLDPLVDALGIVIAPFTAQQARIARSAYERFGKGSGHPARLNFGDCFAYALAIETDEPLLFKGDDFGHTDVRVAVPG